MLVSGLREESQALLLYSWVCFLNPAALDAVTRQHPRELELLTPRREGRLIRSQTAGAGAVFFDVFLVVLTCSQG